MVAIDRLLLFLFVLNRKSTSTVYQPSPPEMLYFMDARRRGHVPPPWIFGKNQN
jgi:hypothetical protein